MRRSRVSAMLATLIATIAMALGTAVAGAQPAAAAPHNHTHYPPPPPRLTVNKGVVKYGVSVRVRGYRFTSRERVTITVRYKARNSSRWQVVKRVVTRASRFGDIGSTLRMARPGTVVITAVGSRSRSGASVMVLVIDKRKGGGGWSWRNVAFTSSESAPAITAAPAQQPTDNNTAALAVAGLAVLGMAGSVLVTRRIVRRRRTVIAG